MQKLDYKLFENITNSGITSNELNLLLYVGQYQDEFGCIKGIYYKETCEILKLSTQGFYDALEGLQKKHIITYSRNKSDYDIVICGNNSVATNNFSFGYISLGHPILHDDQFIKLPVKAKLMTMHLIREELIRRKETEYKETAHSMRRVKSIFLKKWSNILNVQQRMISAYLKKLTPFLSLCLEKGRMYYITFRTGTLFDVNAKQGESMLREQQVNMAIRRNRVKKFSETKRLRLVRKLGVFSRRIRKTVNFDLSLIMENSLRQINSAIKNQYKWSRFLALGKIEEVLLCEIEPE